MNCNIFIFILVVNATNELEKYDEKYVIKFLNSFLQESKWDLLTNTKVHDYENSYEFYVCQLILNNELYSKKNIVTKKNVHEKLNNTSMLINYEFTINLAKIVIHIKHLATSCNIIKQHPISANGPAEYAECVNLLIPNVDKSKQLITRYISAIHFLMSLLNVNINTFILNELIKFIELVSREINENDCSYVDKIESKFKEEYEGNNSNLQKILKNFFIDEYDVSVKMDYYYIVNYMEDNNLQVFEHYKFAENKLNKSLAQMIETYTKHGFFYDTNNNVTCYFYDL